MNSRVLEVTLDEIDFDKVEKCTDSLVLIRFIELLKYDGGYFPELLRACTDKLKSIDFAMHRKICPDVSISEEIKSESLKDLLDWAKSTQIEDSQRGEASENTKYNNPPIRTGPTSKAPISKFSAFPAPASRLIERQAKSDERRDLKRDGTRMKDYYDAWDKYSTSAEREFIKGKEAEICQEWEEAEEAYNQSICFGSTEDARVYKRRGFARLQLEKYMECVQDFDYANRLGDENDPEIFLWRGRAKLHIGLHVEAKLDFERALENCRENEQLEKSIQFEISRAQKECDKHKPGNFKKIEIEEISDDDEENNKVMQEIYKKTSEAIEVLPSNQGITRQRIPIQIIEED